ncbi:retrovirus-related pol polyprotein from transposon TNT 1-94 [Tanacetum coccineum]|uniref:Retrovirus-related pol polyprotein from transposon TNT 1-94 n=1 Tax=Tanacetum coccineum TaxID=301880 RepID=A0ABQ5FPH6_9ASTR
MSLESLEVILKTHEKNEYAWGDKYEQMEYDLKIRDLKLEEKQKELDQALKERDDFKEKLEKWSNAAVLQNEVLNKQRYLSDKSCIGFGVESSSGMDSENSSRNTNSSESSYPNFQKAKGFHSVPPPTGTIIPPRANVSFTGIDELAIRNKVLNQENTKSSQPEIDRNKVIIEDWVDSDDEETVLNSSEIQKKTVSNSENSETSFENRSPSSQNSVGQVSRKTGFGHKGGKLCFVCYSPNHLIKDCNLHERTFKQTQTHKPKGTQGSRDTRPVWNNIQRVNHSNFSGNSRYPHQRRSFIPSAVLTREGLKSTARPKLTRTVPSKSTANVVYQGTARPKVPHAVPSQSTGRPYYPRMDNTRPRTSSFSRTPHRPQRPKKIMKSIWVKKESTVGSQTVLPKIVSVKGSAMINQTWRPKGAYLDSVNRDNGSYTLKQFEANRRITQVIKVVMWLFGNDSNRRKNLRKRNHQVNSTGLLARMIEEMNISEPLKLHYMDLFGTVSDRRVNRKVMTMEQSIKNQLMNDVLCKKGIKREYSIARTPQQNGVAERKNRTLIEAARTMLADSLLPIQFWAEAVNTACYVLNRVLVTKPQMKTPYEILMGRSPNISFMRPFGCPLTILNTLDHLGKFDGKSEEGYLLGYSTNSKGFRVYNRVTRKVQDCLHVNFLENQENQKGKGPDWIFDDQAVLFHGGSPPPPSINPVQNKQHTADKEVPLSSDEQALHDELNKDRVNEVLYQEQSTSIAQDGCQKCNSYMATSHKIGNVKQPPGFEDPAHPNKVYIVVKALYGLHQAPRAWNERLSTFLLKHGYKRGAIDKTLSSMVIDFEDLMQKRIQDGGVNILEEDWFLAMQETNDYAISSTEAEYVGSSSFVPQFLDAKLTT